MDATLLTQSLFRLSDQNQGDKLEADCKSQTYQAKGLIK